MSAILTRRQALGALGSALIANSRLQAASGKPLRGVFPIMATPFTAEKAVDFEDLTREVDFLERCGAHGMVWPQLASLFRTLSKDERMQGMELLAGAIKGKKAALILGVQAANTEQMLEYARKAESLEPDALIAMPPYEAKSLDDYRAYYRALAGVAKRPVFIQTTGGARNLIPSVDFVVELANQFPQFGYVKEEAPPAVDRIRAFMRRRPAIKAVFSGDDGLGLTYEMRFGADGTMPLACYTDLLTQTWDLYHGGQQAKAREIFSKFVLMENIGERIPGTPVYIMKKRGVFKSSVTRPENARTARAELTAEQIAEIDYNFEEIRPYLKA
jgi:dihydrodipicolinate synthase/N-acetylneuraminate lyase